MINVKQQQALKCAVDTLVAPVAEENEETWQEKTSHFQVDEKIVAIMEKLPRKAKNDFLMLLSILASPLPGLLLQGWPARFSALPLKKREALLYRWANSVFPSLRMAFTSLKRISLFLYYASSNDGYHPAWEQIGYPGPPVIIDKPQRKALTISLPDRDIIECDTLVVGSGAGGGVVAGTLSEQGKEVVVIEKGDYVSPQERTNLEQEMVSRLYESQGMQTNHDYSISLFAGSCLGGGTTVNWSVAWRPTDKLREEWAGKHALPQLREDVFSRCIDDVIKGIHVVDKVPFNAQSHALVSGSERLQFACGALPQNIQGCEAHGYEQCGFCLFGCRYGNKQDMTETFLQQAQNHGAKIYSGMKAHRLQHKAGQIIGVEATVNNVDGTQRTITIKAKSYVLSGGAIHTPALLLRSGLTHPQLGRNLYIHPATLVLGRYANPVESWRGGMMTAYSDAAANIDGGYGCKIEPAPLHSGLLAAVLPWQGHQQHKALMSVSSYYAGFAVITRDRFGGRVTIDRDGAPHIHYRLHKYDLRHSMAGMAAASAIHAAAGAERVVLTHHQGVEFDTQTLGHEVAHYHNKIAALPWTANYSPMFSSHLMGTCRMGGNYKSSPVNPQGQFAGISNLYIADGSLFPSASGINPMVTIQSLARYIALGMQ